MYLSPPYAELTRRFRRIDLVRGASSMLQWDSAAVMPEGGAAIRGDQLAELQVTAHERITDPAVAALLDEAEAGAGALDGWARANLREMRRQWVHAAAVPSDLVGALATATSACEVRWRTARGQDDFAGLRPLLAEVLRLVREVAAAKSAHLGVSPYEALLDENNPGLRAATVDAIFDDLAAFLPGFIDAALAHQAARPPVLPLPGPFPVENQRTLGRRLMAGIGFDFNRGRLDESHHPFCGGVPDDVRITTRWSESDVLSGLFAVVHETGHALYELGLPGAWRGQPVGSARGMMVHESQSLLIEMQVCRSRAFLGWVAPELAQAFGGQGPAWSPENLYRLGTSVERSLIRVDADEATYPAHVILRHRLEKAMVAGDLALADLPGAWREAMRSLVGVEPPDDRDGCLQDIHWPVGAWGYFPSYTLGAMLAAQLFDAAARAEPAIPGAIARGDFAPLVAWLRREVHEKGALLSTEELVVAATGRPLDAGVFKRHLERRYLGD